MPETPKFAITRYEYDDNGNRIREQRHGGYRSRTGKLVKEDGEGLVLSFHYDKRNRLIRVEDGLGAVIRYRYDVQGKRTYQERTVTEGIRQAIHYGYDRAGHLTEIKEELNSGLPACQGEPKYAVTRYRYDGNGNRVEIVNPEGYQIHREYDSCDRLTAERVLDKQNRIDRTIQIAYDLAGNIRKITRQGKDGKPWDIQYDYDLKDRIIHVEDCKCFKT